MSVLGDINTKQSQLLRKVGAYVQKRDIDDVERARQTQLEDLRGQVTAIEAGTDELEKAAEDCEQRVSALGG